MPYTHSGEIGDVWKHLPLCDILEIESPERYFETNSAFAEYKLRKNTRNEYGIYHLLKNAPAIIEKSRYFNILGDSNFIKTGIYLGSSALAMKILEQKSSHFYFYDIEKEPLEDILRFSQTLRIHGRVSVFQAESISAYLHNGYCFNQNDLIFIDPYQPFDCNKFGETFFDIFERSINSQAKTLLWYGYDSLDSKNKIIKKLYSLSTGVPELSIHAFDIRQKSMGSAACTVNPGVPGCGIAAVNLKKDSIQSIENYLKSIGEIYRNIEFEGIRTSLYIDHLLL